MKYVMDDNWELVPVEDRVINESRRRKRKRPVGGYFVTYTTGYPNHDTHMFNVHNGTDFPKEEQESTEAANEVSSELAGGSTEAGIGGGEASGNGDGAIGGDGGASAGGEGGGCCEDLATDKEDTELQESSSLSAEEKMILFNRGERRENVRACSDEKLALY